MSVKGGETRPGSEAAAELFWDERLRMTMAHAIGSAFQLDSDVSSVLQCGDLSLSARPTPLETFALENGGERICRKIVRRNRTRYKTQLWLDSLLSDSEVGQSELASHFDSAFLRSRTWPELDTRAATVRVIDLFSGCGAMSLGVWEASRSIGRTMQTVLALDSDDRALEVYKRNFPSAKTMCCDISKVLDSRLGSRASRSEKKLVREVGAVEVLIGGPPCQGHSDLNNHSRRADPKNRLYDRMGRAAELLNPEHIIIENAPLSAASAM
jgi:hypothetical protein